ATCTPGCAPTSRSSTTRSSPSPTRTASSRSRASPPANTRSRPCTRSGRARRARSPSRTGRRPRWTCRTRARPLPLTPSPGVPREPSAVVVGGSPGVFPFAPWRHRLSVLLVASTLALIFVGGLVTSTGSGLSVPDWPLSYGMVMPPMVGGVFYEHGHRMVASAVGFLTLVLAVWTARAESRASLRRLAWAALAAVIAQGVLGGLTVLYLLPTPISVTHACLAQAFFCITIALAYLTSREWVASTGARDDVAGVRGAAVAATA